MSEVETWFVVAPTDDVTNYNLENANKHWFSDMKSAFDQARQWRKVNKTSYTVYKVTKSGVVL